MHKSGSNPLPLANEHFVQLYRTDSELVDTVSTYALDVLDYDRQGVIFFATRRHCDLIKRALMLHEMDVGDAIARGQVTFVHVEDVVPKIMRGDVVDRDAFRRLATAYLDRAGMDGKYRHIHVFGEIVNTLWHNGNKSGTLSLEHLWNELRTTQAFTLYCAFHVDRHATELLNGEMRDVLCTHNAIMSEVPVDGIRQRRVFADVSTLARAAVAPARPLPAPSQVSPIV